MQLFAPGNGCVRSRAVDARERSVRGLREEREVEHADDASIDEVQQHRESLTGHAIAGELDDQVVD